VNLLKSQLKVLLARPRPVGAGRNSIGMALKSGTALGTSTNFSSRSKAAFPVKRDEHFYAWKATKSPRKRVDSPGIANSWQQPFKTGKLDILD
jgi:hypothetical protein